MPRALQTWMIVIGALLVLRPISDPQMWWTLSHGREALAGSISPSQQLLTLDVVAEADWLGGVPFFFLWTIVGPLGLAATPVFFSATLLLITQRFVADKQQLTWALCTPFFVVAVRPCCQPTPAFFDCLMLLCVLWVNTARGGVWIVVVNAILVCAWSNLAAHPTWAFLWLLLVQPPRVGPNSLKSGPPSTAEQWPQLLLAICGALLGGCLTPRGPLTWRDSIVHFAPEIFAPGSRYMPESWLSLLHGNLMIGDAASLVLWCVAIVFRLVPAVSRQRQEPGTPHQSSRRFLAEAISILMAGVINRSHLPFVAIWAVYSVSCETVAVNQAAGKKSRLATNVGHRRVSNRTRCGLALLTLFAVTDALGILPGSNGRLSFGIAQMNDIRLFNAPLESGESKPVIAWASDERSAGMLVWLDPNARIIDHPKRALTGGRMAAHDAIIQDLEMDRRAAFRTEAGTWRGWVRQLTDWNADLVLVPVEKERLNQSLARSTWKSLDLDSPVLVYGKAEDPRLAATILETLGQQGFVETGPWQPTMEIYDSHGWRFDVIELAGGGPDSSAAIRQSTLFRSMDIPLASLRAILPVRRITRETKLRAEFIRCQELVAYQEWSTFGQASEFRRRVIHTLRPESAQLEHEWFYLNDAEQADSATWADGISRYLNGDLMGAIASLTPSTDHRKFAVAMLWLELGDSRKAFEIVNDVQKNGSVDSVKIAARYYQLQLEQYAAQ